jgi:hypothetical protein
MFPSSGEGEPTLLGPLERLKSALSKGSNRVGVLLPSLEEENISSFLNAVFSGYFEFRTMERVHKPSDSEN